jgi:hypothetical protein
MKYDIRKCDRCNIAVKRARLSHGTLHTPHCGCGGKMVPVAISDDDVREAEITATTTERERVIRILTLCFPHFQSPALEKCLRAIRDGAEPESVLGATDGTA